MRRWTVIKAGEMWGSGAEETPLASRGFKIKVASYLFALVRWSATEPLPHVAGGVNSVTPAPIIPAPMRTPVRG
jgi:hypothetical protein